MTEEQSWDTCKHHLGDLDIDLDAIAKAKNEVSLMRKIFPESERDAIFREECINQWHYCTHPELIASNAYLGDGIPNEQGGYTPVALLFVLGLIDDPSHDWLGEDKFHLDNAIKQGLAMCTHCKYHESG
ncbi:MAG: hypothetical protein GY861_09435 [bacterium]|nr:hypothetical protein [bacterium]